MFDRHIVRAPTVRYPEAGYCIYCGAKGVPLTDEHILPYGLGGHYILPKASCVICQKSITRVETTVMRMMMNAYRVRVGLTGRHKDSRTYLLPVEYKTRTGEHGRLFVPRLSHPASLMLVQLNPPGLLRPFFLSPYLYRPWTYVHDIDALHLIRNSIPNLHGIQAGRFYLVEFCRMLAKICHAFAVAEGIPSGYSFILKDFIRGTENNHALRFVGGIERTHRPEPNVPHRIILATPRSVGEMEYIVAQIRLFAYLGAPVYEAVVAERRKQQVIPAN